MTRDFSLRLSPSEAADEDGIRSALCREHGLAPAAVGGLRVVRRAIDARHKQVAVCLTVRVWEGEPAPPTLYTPIPYPSAADRPQAIVVGAGPCGLFAALRLIELGVRPVVVERGKEVHQRRRDVAAISRTGRPLPDSNACFGEGGAGAFSDGKLFTRSHKRGDVPRILRILCQHGAPEAILADVHPHIGTDLLPTVVANIRQTILRCGGEVRFSTRMQRLLIHRGQVLGIVYEAEGSEGELRGPVILAIGHSARDTYQALLAQQVPLRSKGLALGLRLEHPAQLIDRIQYHSPEGKGPHLPTAEYSFVTNIRGRGVYSFCMCPGGTVVPVATADEQVAVNGMSASRRNAPWSNAGIVVEIRPSDLSDPTLLDSQTRAMLSQHLDQPFDPQAPLSMMQLQQLLEHNAWLAAGGTGAAPAQRMTDFVNQKISASLPPSSYAPGLSPQPLHFLLPPFVSQRLSQAFRLFGQRARGFLTHHAVAIGVETRTSSPLRILRQGDTLQPPTLPGLFPAGEGAGYAGGIVSAAIDGERCAEALAASMNDLNLHASA